MGSIIQYDRQSNCGLLVLFVFSLAIGSTCAVAADRAEEGRHVGKVTSKQLRELSGIAASRQNPDTLWVHNDGANRLVLAVKTSGEPRALVSWPVAIEDFEDIAIGPGPKAGADYLYIGDIGDNNEERPEIRIVRFAEPNLSEARDGQVAVESAEEFRLKYPDGAHNAETLIVDPVSGDVFVVTKEKQNALLYTCPASRLEVKSVANLEFLGVLELSSVSGGAIARDGSRIILRREDEGWLWNREQGQSVAAALRTPPRRIPVRGREQGRNGEAVSFSPDGNSYYSVSEGKDPVIYRFEIPATAREARR